MSGSKHDNDSLGIKVSIVIPVRNEEYHIHKTLDSIVNQNFPREKYEIIVVDGMSEDRTRNILHQYQIKYPGLIRILDNPGKIQPTGWNIGIRNSNGKYVHYTTGHVLLDDHYLSTLVKELDFAPNEVAGIGGIYVQPEDEKPFAKIVADVESSILSHTSRESNDVITFVDTINWGVYRKEVLESVGLADERFTRGNDLELNSRIRRAGYKLMTCRNAKGYYYRKYNSLKSFSKRMMIYGMWAAFAVKKNHNSFKILYLLPLIMSISLILLIPLMFFYPLLDVVILFGLLVYFIILLISSIHLSFRRKNIKYLLAIPIYMIEHFCYGFGFLVGIFKKIPNRKV